MAFGQKKDEEFLEKYKIPLIIAAVIIFTSVLLFFVRIFSGTDDSLATGGAFVSGDVFRQSSEPQKKPKMQSANSSLSGTPVREKKVAYTTSSIRRLNPSLSYAEAKKQADKYYEMFVKRNEEKYLMQALKETYPEETETELKIRIANLPADQKDEMLKSQRSSIMADIKAEEDKENKEIERKNSCYEEAYYKDEIVIEEEKDEDGYPIMECVGTDCKPKSTKKNVRTRTNLFDGFRYNSCINDTNFSNMHAEADALEAKKKEALNIYKKKDVKKSENTATASVETTQKAGTAKQTRKEQKTVIKKANFGSGGSSKFQKSGSSFGNKKKQNTSGSSNDAATGMEGMPDLSNIGGGAGGLDLNSLMKQAGQ